MFLVVATLGTVKQCEHWRARRDEPPLAIEATPLNVEVTCNYDTWVAHASSQKVTFFRRLDLSHWFMPITAGWWLSSAEPMNSSSSSSTLEHATRQRCLAVSGRVVSLLPFLSFNMGVDGGQLSRRAQCGCTLMGCIHTWIVPSVEWSLPQEARPLNRDVRCNYDTWVADGSSQKVTVFCRSGLSHWYVPITAWGCSAQPMTL